LHWQVPNALFKTLSPLLKATCFLLRVASVIANAYGIPTPRVPGLGELSADSETYKGLVMLYSGAGSAGAKYAADASASTLEEQYNKAISESDRDLLTNGDAASGDSLELNGTAAQVQQQYGAALLQLQELMIKHGHNPLLCSGGLQRAIERATGRVLWVCPEHAKHDPALLSTLTV